MKSYIYFLLDKNGVIVYVGQTKRLMRRISEHHRFKEFESYRAIECKASRLISYEKRWINRFNPKYNGTATISKNGKALVRIMLLSETMEKLRRTAKEQQRNISTLVVNALFKTYGI